MENSDLLLAELYRAYRKAKYEAFRDKSHFSALAYVQYEKTLDRNLRSLRDRLIKGNGRFWQKAAQIGGYLYAPKTVIPPSNTAPHWATLDPIADWAHRCEGRLADASFRLIMTPTIDSHVMSAYWIMTVGAKLDAGLNQEVSFGARLSRRWVDRDELVPSFNNDSLRLFKPYFSSYREWREKGLQTMRAHLEQGERVIAVTMDIRRFYHSICPDFLLQPELASLLGVTLTESELRANEALVALIWDWYRSTPDNAHRPEGGIPVGLSASRVISNILLKEFDNRILERVSPLYYGRYVDDIFLVIRDPGAVTDSASFSQWLSERLGDIATNQPDRRLISINLSYSRSCQIEFVQDKQKVFRLEGEYGLDLLSQIEDQIRRQSSEHRLLPELEVEEGKFIAKSLRASGDTGVVVDALRKADSLSLRRLEFSLLLRDLEAYERDLPPNEWRTQREKFFDVVYRHVVTPSGFFEYASYLYRAIGLGVACGDFELVHKLLDRFEEVVAALRRTSTAGTSQSAEFASCLAYYCQGFLEVAIQAATVPNASVKKIYSVVARVRRISNRQVAGPLLKELTPLVRRMLRADLGRRPYKDHWYYDNEKIGHQPSYSKHGDVLRTLRLGAIRSFRKQAQRHPPYWPALAFPTRPLSIPEIYLFAPNLFLAPTLATSVILALRGARLSAQTASPPRIIGRSLLIENSRPPRVDVALTSYWISHDQWIAGITGTGDHSLQRYMAIRRLVRNAMADPSRPNYILFPECSIPAKWAVRIATTLGMNGISFICGMENWSPTNEVRNDALISIASNWAGYNCAVMYSQPKFFPAHKEGIELAEAGKTLYKPTGNELDLLVYANGSFRFGVLLCSDLTDINNRAFFRGKVDALIALEWNMDVETFSGLVEATSYDLHSYMIQVNNREFGDSRVRGPYAERFRRDMVRVKGGDTDYYVVAKLNVPALQTFHNGLPDPAHPAFKPMPIGYPKPDS